MNFLSRPNTWIVLSISSLVCSNAFFLSLNDPEGSNLLVIAALAVVTGGVSFLVYRAALGLSVVRRLLLALAAQIIFVTLLAFFLG